jgi:hypothetical protein
MAGTIRRVGALAGLRKMLDELDAHPTLPVPSTVTVNVHADNDLDGFERVTRAAHVMGVPAVTTAKGTQRAEKKFGTVTYAVEYYPVNAAVTK